jgi:putative aldouronate transport system permease protein
METKTYLNSEEAVIQRKITRKRSGALQNFLKHKSLFLLGLPGILCFLIFKYAPMYGIIIAFQDYNPFAGIQGSEWVGFQHFSALFKDPDFFLILKNALVISLLNIIIFPVPIILALLLNELRNQIFKKAVQTLVYLPHFMSWVIIVSLTYLFFSSEIGLVNKLIEALGGGPLKFLFDTNYFYPFIVGQELWRSVGWGSIIYMAAIAGVDVALYDAAKIDGAGRFKQIWHITIPAIVPTMIILFILQLGSTLDVNFEQLYLMQNPSNTHLSEVFETFIYKIGINGAEYSYSTAIGIFKSVVGLVLVLGTNYLANKKGHEGIW